MGGLSWIHWVVVLLIVIMVFGTKKLRNLGSDLGGAVKGFKDGMKDGASSEEAPASAKPQVAQASAEKTTIDVEARTKS